MVRVKVSKSPPSRSVSDTPIFTNFDRRRGLLPMTRYTFMSTITTNPIKAPVHIRNQGQASSGSVDLRE